MDRRPPIRPYRRPADPSAGSIDLSAPPPLPEAPPAPDPAAIMILATALIGLGVTMIYSASSGVAPASPGPRWRFWADPGLRQLLFVPPALFLMWVASRVPYSVWRLRRWYSSPSLWLMVVALGLLVGVLFAPAHHGARRWFFFEAPGFSFNFQPSELAKLALVLCLAALLADSRFDARRLFRSRRPRPGEPPAGAPIGLLVIGLVAITSLLVVLADFGTAFLIGVVGLCVVLAGGFRFRYVLGVLPVAAAAGAVFILTSDYRVERIKTFLSGGDPQGEGYHILQSKITIASGSWFGQGLGCGIQKLDYLPEDTTDFIFAALCEELGLVGGFIVIALFILLLWQLRSAMRSAPDRLGQLIVLGVALLIGLQAAMNIAVVTDSVPTKGISLPFVSAGGSGLIITAVALGLAAGVARRGRRLQAADED